MTEYEKAAASHLTAAQKDDISAYYVWATVARRRRLQANSSHRRAICIACHGPRKPLHRAPKGRCQDCWKKAQAAIHREKHENYHRLFDRPAVLILG